MNLVPLRDHSSRAGKSAPEPGPNAPAAPPARHFAFLVAAFLPLLALIAWQVWRTYWLSDDAFISFRFVRNFVEGHGLVFNVGERVEGYTNFLWVLELAALWKAFGIAPDVACTILSTLFTAGSIALTALLAFASPFRDRRAFVAWGALLLLGASHTFAVWGTSGLETRQFTFFVLLACACLHLAATRPWLLVAASLAIAAGEYTRPEGTLLFACCFVWLVFDRLLQRRLRLRDLVIFALPFVVLVALHYAWRFHYYGEFWPNTYYAKHVRPWPEAGVRYFAAAALECGLYLLVPAALVGTFARFRRGDTMHLLSWAILLPHMAYLVRIGGDHFEYRVLDFYWPLLAVAAVEGVLATGRWGAGVRGSGGERLDGRGRRPLVRDAIAAALLALLLVYTSVVQIAKEQASAAFTTRAETQRMLVSLPRANFPRLYRLPGMPSLLAVYDRVMPYLAAHGIAAPWVEHKAFWLEQIEKFAPYEALHHTGLLPADAVTSRGAIGIYGYYLADVALIDAMGLTDAHVARQPGPPTNDLRYMAHDRTADPAYIAERGFNLAVRPAAASADEALEGAGYALRIADDLWMPFEVVDAAWADAPFLSGPDVRRWKLLRTIGCFAEGDLDDWTVEGDAFKGEPTREVTGPPRFQALRRCEAGWIFDSRAEERGAGEIVDAVASDAAPTGRALSPTFTVPPGASLELWLGGVGPDAGVRLRRGAVVLETWTSRDRIGISPERHDLSARAGDELSLEVFDDSGEGGEGYVLVGEVSLIGR